MPSRDAARHTLLRALPDQVPDIWGEGILFGLSGVDGETVTASGFVGSLGPEPYGVLFHTPTKRQFAVRAGAAGRVRCATGDAVVVEVAGAQLAYRWLHWHSLVGACPRGVELALGLLGAAGEVAATVDRPVVSTGQQAEEGTVALVRDQDRSALCYGESPQEAIDRCQAGLAADATIETRLPYLNALPSLDDPEQSRLLRKAAAVAKVNILAPEGVNRGRWSTPDRMPHRHMWLWDSVFHTFLQNRVDPDLSYELIRSITDRAHTAESAAAAGQPEWAGKITHRMDVNGSRSVPIQPPALAWAFAENATERGSTNGLAEVIPTLERYLQWDMEWRDSNGNGLLGWVITDNPLGNCDECGLDNSPRFDVAEPLDNPDFSALLANDALVLADLCDRVGDASRARRWRDHAARIGAAIQALLWDDDSGF